jgi:hypothetical protein
MPIAAIMGERPAAGADAIEIRVETISQLFHSLDPSPFREKDLDEDAEEFIVAWARELPADQPLRIVVHLPEQRVSTPEARAIPAAFARFFAYRAGVLALDLKELFRVGRGALAVGATVLTFSVLASQMIEARFAPAPWARVIGESLIIFGWVANWRPIEIFLYEWWPIHRRRRLYERLAAADVELRTYKPDSP